MSTRWLPTCMIILPERRKQSRCAKRWAIERPGAPLGEFAAYLLVATANSRKPELLDGVCCEVR